MTTTTVTREESAQTVLELLAEDLTEARTDLNAARRAADHSPNTRNLDRLDIARAKVDALLDIYLEERDAA